MAQVGHSVNYTITTGLQLYRYLLRQCRKLPPDASAHYKHAIKQSYKQHVEETDPVRIEEIISRAMKDAEWILKKYDIK